MRAVFIATLAVVIAAAAASPLVVDDRALVQPNKGATAKCHNVTGTCLPHGFVCANEEVVPHAKRCDGVEDCGDGTDEFMCHHEDDTPMHLRSAEARMAAQQASCIQCTCTASVHTVVSGSAWWNYALHAPTDFIGLMTGTGPYAGKNCDPKCAFQILMGFYRKTGVCRGWLCCARQRQCTLCNNVGICFGRHINNRCYA